MKNFHRFLYLTLFLALVTGSASGQPGVIFQEDFDDGVADGFSPTTGQWNVIGQAYRCLTTGFENYGISWAGQEEWVDYHLEFDLMVFGSIAQLCRFRGWSTGQSYELVIRAKPFNDAWLFKWTAGFRSTLAHEGNLFNLHEIWHHFEIDLVGNKIMVFFDDQQVFEYRDESTPHLNGGFALAGYSGGIQLFQEAFFDNVLAKVFVVPGQAATWGQVKKLYR